MADDAISDTVCIRTSAGEFSSFSSLWTDISEPTMMSAPISLAMSTG